MFGRISGRNKDRAIKTVGIAGVSRGTGTTFCTMMMAYFERKVKKEAVAVFERNYSGHLLKLCGEERGCVRGIDIFGRGHGLPEGGRYSYLFFDYGTQIQKRGGEAPEFSECSIKLVTAGACLWKQQELLDFVEQSLPLPGNEEWIYLLPFASEAVRKEMERKVHRKLYRVAAEKEWYHMGTENLALWEEILQK